MGKTKHIFICFITDDWNRRRCVIQDNLDSTGFNFIPWSQRNQIVNNLTIYYIDKDISNEALLQKAEKIRSKDLNLSINKSIKLYNIMSSIIEGRSLHVRINDIFDNNKLVLKKIISDYGSNNISLFHIPERMEVMQGNFSPLGQKIKEFILSQDIAYIDGLALCGLNLNDFHEHDGHPNASGYNKIFNSFSNKALNTLNLQNKP
jgi:hypothetical protein